MKPKGWRNESRRHSLASKGIKTAQRINNLKLCDYNPDLNKYEVGDSTRISIEEPLYDDKGNRFDGEMGRITQIKDGVATVKLDDQRIVAVPLGELTAKQIVYQPVKSESRFKVSVPPTMEQGSYSTTVTGSAFESKEKEALWDYNSAREHDGLPPVKRMPKGTKYMRVD